MLTHIGFRPFFHAMVTNDSYVAIGLYLYFLISGVALPIRWQAAGCIKTGTQDLLDQNLLSFFYPTSKRVATWGSLPPGGGSIFGFLCYTHHVHMGVYLLDLVGGYAYLCMGPYLLYLFG